VGAAPPIGDAALWQPRIAQGADTLHMHALQGFQGEKGFMPAKGGRVDLSDEEIIAAVDYMVEQSGQ
jgi:cytochrome c5